MNDDEVVGSCDGGLMAITAKDLSPRVRALVEKGERLEPLARHNAALAEQAIAGLRKAEAQRDRLAKLLHDHETGVCGPAGSIFVQKINDLEEQVAGLSMKIDVRSALVQRLLSNLEQARDCMPIVPPEMDATIEEARKSCYGKGC